MNVQPAVPALIAVGGIIIGWALKELSDFSRGIAATRRERRQALSILIRLYYQMIRVEQLLEQTKDAAKDWKLFEKFRQRYAEKYGDRSEQFVSDIRSAIRVVSGTDPWLSVQLEAVLEGYLTFKDIRLQGLQTLGAEPYITALSTLEAAYMMHAQLLRSAIVRLSRRCGVFDFITTVWNLRKRRKLQETKTQPSERLQEMLSDVMAQMRDEPSA